MCINRKTGSAYRRRLIPGGGQWLFLHNT
jgi:hypothetical protein